MLRDMACKVKPFVLTQPNIGECPVQKTPLKPTVLHDVHELVTQTNSAVFIPVLMKYRYYSCTIPHANLCLATSKLLVI